MTAVSAFFTLKSLMSSGGWAKFVQTRTALCSWVTNHSSREVGRDENAGIEPDLNMMNASQCAQLMRMALVSLGFCLRAKVCSECHRKWFSTDHIAWSPHIKILGSGAFKIWAGNTSPYGYSRTPIRMEHHRIDAPCCQWEFAQINPSVRMRRSPRYARRFSTSNYRSIIFMHIETRPSLQGTSKETKEPEELPSNAVDTATSQKVARGEDMESGSKECRKKSRRWKISDSVWIPSDTEPAPGYNQKRLRRTEFDKM
ncbi:hypothetical protein B0H13DRAFT_1882955 [Mycena leptocephala]|nr:hypothetical protein B0H13DRAFT_1882955 [Mycena leptocephala]